MSFLFGRNRKGSIPPGATFRITEQGREKLQEFGGDPKSRILMAAETGGTSDIDELSRASGVSKGQVERLLPQLVRGGYVQYVGRQSEDID